MASWDDPGELPPSRQNDDAAFGDSGTSRNGVFSPAYSSAYDWWSSPRSVAAGAATNVGTGQPMDLGRPNRTDSHVPAFESTLQLESASTQLVPDTTIPAMGDRWWDEWWYPPLPAPAAHPPYEEEDQDNKARITCHPGGFVYRYMRNWRLSSSRPGYATLSGDEPCKGNQIPRLLLKTSLPVVGFVIILKLTGCLGTA